MSILEPRALPPDAYKGWLKNGARIVQRSWDVWLPAMFVLSCVANALTLSTQLLVLVLAAGSGVVHGLNAATAARYARRERFGWTGLIACWATEIQAFWPVFRRSLVVRTLSVLALVLASFLLQGMSSHHGTVAPAADTSHTLPFWLTFFLPWNNVWFFALLLQNGGPLSMQYWLMTRCGTDGTTATALLVQAFRKNSYSFARLIGVSVLLLLLASWLPFLTVLFECYWVSVMFCVWNEVFMGHGELEKQEAVQTHRGLTGQIA